VCRIGFAADVAHNSMAASCPSPDFADRVSKRLAGWEPAAHNRCAIRAYDDTVKRPARCRQVEGARAHVCFQLSGASDVSEAEGLGVEGATPEEHGQATTSPTVLVECGINVDDEALSQCDTPPETETFRDSNSMPCCWLNKSATCWGWLKVGER
jgi:hypothetical protein